jgi:hypothetical protein
MKRGELFVTTKVLESIADCRSALQTSLSKLGLTYVDLYLIHAPFGTWDLKDAWRQMEALVDAGLCRSIGGSSIALLPLEPPTCLRKVTIFAAVVPKKRGLQLSCLRPGANTVLLPHPSRGQPGNSVRVFAAVFMSNASIVCYT